jgi:transketolase
VAEIKSMERIGERFAAFGWHVLEIDGHDIGAIMAALAEAKRIKGRPTVVVAHTVKGKGVSFMENQVGWHGTAPKPDQVRAALAELDASGEGGDEK